MKTRRLKMARVSKHFWIYWMTQDYVNPGFEVVEGIPKGAEFVRAFHDEHTGHLYFVFSHETFAPVPFGGKIPVMDIVLHSSLVEQLLQPEGVEL